MKEKCFAVKSKYESVYLAFITECEKIGWVWTEDFNSKSSIRHYVNNSPDSSGKCIFLSTNFAGFLGKAAFSFSSTDKKIIDLDTEFEDAMIAAKLLYEKTLSNFSMKLNNLYEAIIDDDMINVGCQSISFETFDQLVKLVKLYKEKKILSQLANRCNRT